MLLSVKLIMQDDSYFVCMLTNLPYIIGWRYNCLYFAALVNTNCNLLTNGYLNFDYKDIPFVTTVIKLCMECCLCSH